MQTYKKLLGALIIALFAVTAGVPIASAAPAYRGFNSDIGAPIESLIPQLKDEWGVNLLRIGLSDFEQQDSINSMDEYWDMMEPLLERLDDLIPLLCAAGIKVQPALMSAPGGLDADTSGGAKLRIFSEAWAQEGLLEFWDHVSERYLAQRDCIYGYDVLNEPAQAAVAPGLKNWSELALALVDTIRANDDTTKILIKSRYGNPAHLKTLPDFTQPGVAISVHLYPDIRYIHQGLSDIPLGLAAPASKAIINTSFTPIANYRATLVQKFKNGTIPYVPDFEASEFAVARYAPNAADYISRLIAFIEGESDRGQFIKPKVQKGSKKKKKLTPKQKKQRTALRQLNFASWAFHSIGDARIWDPRYSPDYDDETYVDPPQYTELGEVLKYYFSKN